MNNLVNQTPIVLIGGTPHTGKSTLGKALASKLQGEYIATDNLARQELSIKRSNDPVR